MKEDIVQPVNSILHEKLAGRKLENNLRKLQQENTLIDFSSNDYLGFSRSITLKEKINAALKHHPFSRLGATGSRLISGNTAFTEDLEKKIARIHLAENGLIFNSGYTANLSLFSSIPQKNDTIIYDELIHASVIDGARLSLAKRIKFRHNDVEDLQNKIRRSSGRVYVAVEHIYSMDGDLAQLQAIAACCQAEEAFLIVDEAHAFGVLDHNRLNQLQLNQQVFARVITFGKALGLHGAVVIGTDALREYLINFARPFIYTTALPFSQILAIQVAYEHLLAQPGIHGQLQHKYELLTAHMPAQEQLQSSRNPSPIQCVFIPGNARVLKASAQMQEYGFDIRAIRSPTVPAGKERLRICVHQHNSDLEILALCAHLHHISKNNYAAKPSFR